MAMYADEYSDPYEAQKQKALTRPTAPAPAAPTNFPPPPTGGYTGRGAAPAPAPAPAPAAPAPGQDFESWFQRANAAGGGTFDPSSPETRAQYEQHLYTAKNAGQGGGMGSNAEYAASGDPTGMRAYAKQQGMSEDFARFSNAQLSSWESRKDSNCPPNTPYQAFDGSGCVEKPVDSNKGGGGAGGAGGGGAAGAGGPQPSGGGDPSGISGQMEGVLKGMLAGGTSRYSPEAMQGLLAQIKQRIESSKGTQLRQAESEAAGRGMSRAGRTGTNLAAIRRGAESEFTGQYANVLRAKIDADRQDKLDSLDRSQKYLDSMRDEMYRRDMSAIQRQQFKANLDLAYANIQNQRGMLTQQLQNQRQMLTAQVGYGALTGGL